MTKKQSTDPVIEELHAIRRAIAKRFGNDIRKISEDARERQEKANAPTREGRQEGNQTAGVDLGSLPSGDEPTSATMDG